jgi:hypothetical protein
MTADQGARPRPRQVSLPRRRRLSAPVRAGRRAHPVGRVLAGVLMTLLLGLLYLGQTINLAATNYQVDQLLTERDDLARQVQTLETTMLRWGAEPMVLDRAQQAGLDSLGTRVRIVAR